MPEDVVEHFVLPDSTTSMPGTPREVLENDITPRDEISLNGLGMKKGKSGGLSMMSKTGMEVAQYYTVFNYVPQIQHKNLKYQDRTIVDQAGMKPSPKTFLPGHRKEKS